jgi:hypothetical protein
MSIAVVSTSPPDAICAATAQRRRARAAAAAASSITAAVADALSAIRRQVAADLIHWPDTHGGAHVFIASVDLGSPFAQQTTWVAFHLPHTLPDGDVYPFWLRPDLTRVDGAPIGKVDGAGRNFLHQNQDWLGEPAVMVSLRSSSRDPNIDSPARKLARVLTTVRSS